MRSLSLLVDKEGHRYWADDALSHLVGKQDGGIDVGPMVHSLTLFANKVGASVLKYHHDGRWLGLVVKERQRAMGCCLRRTAVTAGNAPTPAGDWSYDKGSSLACH